MDNELVVRSFLIIKGFIDAKDEHGNTIYGTILALTSRREMKYLSVMFSTDEPSKTMSWDDMLLMHKEKEGESEGSPMKFRYEEELYKFLNGGNVLSNVAKNHNTKQAEQAISRHCLDDLKLKAVSFVEYAGANEDEIEIFERARAKAPPVDEDNRREQDDSSETEEPESEESGEPKAKEDIVIRCEPILAPVGGVAMNELNIGDVVMVQLPEDSIFFKLLSRNIEGFNGVVSAGITGMLQNELGTATVSLSLAEGVAGVLKLSGKVRIKTASTPSDDKRNKKTEKSEIPPNLIIGAAAVIIVIAALAALWYIFR